MKHFLVFITFGFLILGGFSAIAQEGILKGIVTDSTTKETIIGATVQLKGSSVGAVTNVSGEYSFKLSAGTHTIVCTYIGYRTVTKEISITDGQSKEVNFVMAPEEAILNTVVVSAGKFEQKVSELTVSMEVIRPKLVESKNTTNIENVVEQTPGVSVIDGQPNIRGGSGFSYGAGSRVLIMLDDLPLLAPDAQDPKWNSMPVENLEQIEIIKGASSALFGSSALNGVINIRTAYPKEKPETKINVFSGVYSNLKDTAQIWWNDPMPKDSSYKNFYFKKEDRFRNRKQTFGGFNPMVMGANFFHSRQIKNFDLVVGGNVFSDQGYRQYETEQRGRFNFNTRYRFKKIPGLNIGLNGNTQYSLGALFLLWDNAVDSMYRPAGGFCTNFVSKRTNLDPFITYYSKKNDRLSLRSRYYNTENLNLTKQGSLAKMYYYDLQYQKRFEKGLTLTTGLVYNNSVVVSELYGTKDGENKAAYLQLDRKFFKKLNISFGVRGEYYRIDSVETITDIYFLKPQLRKSYIDSTGLDTLLIARHSKVKPLFRFGTSYELGKATFIRASIGQGYRFPSIAERFIKTVASGIPIYPNDSLQPETGWSAEIGIKQGFKVSKWMGYLDIAAFWQEYQNMVQFTFGQWGNPVKDPLFGLGFSAKNVGYARISGVDASLVGSGKIGNVETTVLAGYTYMVPLNLTYWSDTSFVNDPFRFEARLKNTMLKYRFTHMAKADVQCDYKKMFVGVSFRYNSYIRNIDPLFEDTTLNAVPGLWAYRRKHSNGDYVFDFRAGYELTKNFKVSLIVNNVLNREYMIRPADMQPPRLVQVQVGIRF